MVECDGDQHGRDDERLRDAARDADLIREGWDVLRLPNALVLHRTDEALAAIRARCEERELFLRAG